MGGYVLQEGMSYGSTCITGIRVFQGDISYRRTYLISVICILWEHILWDKLYMGAHVLHEVMSYRTCFMVGHYLWEDMSYGNICILGEHVVGKDMSYRKCYMG